MQEGIKKRGVQEKRKGRTKKYIQQKLVQNIKKLGFDQTCVATDGLAKLGETRSPHLVWAKIGALSWTNFATWPSATSCHTCLTTLWHGGLINDCLNCMRDAFSALKLGCRPLHRTTDLLSNRPCDHTPDHVALSHEPDAPRLVRTILCRGDCASPLSSLR